MTLRFDRDFDPRRGEVVDLGPGLRRITANNPGPYTFAGTNTYLVGRRRVAIVDPGPDDPEHVAAILSAVGGALVEAVVVTHGHADHTAAAVSLSRATAAPLAGPAGSTVPPPDRLLGEGDRVDTDAGPLVAIETPGHCADHLCFALPAEGQLLSGDHVMAWSTSVVVRPDGSMGDYLASLDRVAARPEALWWPAHGGPVRDGPAHARALKAHRLEREAMILDALAAGPLTVGGIVAAVYRGLDPALAGAAAQSVSAHLDFLGEKGLASAGDEDDPRWRRTRRGGG